MKEEILKIINKELKQAEIDYKSYPDTSTLVRLTTLKDIYKIVSRVELPVGMPSENSFGQWIDVKDKLPEDANPVLIKLTNNPIMYGNMHTYLGDRYWLIWRSNGTYKENPTYRVTHWMPLPKL